MKTPLPVIRRNRPSVQELTERNRREREAFFKVMLPIFVAVCLWAAYTFLK